MKHGVTVLLLAILATPAGEAAELIVFNDGRALEVGAWEAAGDQAILELKGGGRIIVPLARIATAQTLQEVPAPALEASTGQHDKQEAWRKMAGEYADRIALAATRHGLNPALLAAMAKVESDFDPYAVSRKGACGLLQLLPQTAERFGVKDLFDAEQNLDGGARYVRWLLDRFEGRTELALAAYNAGEQAVQRHGGIPPYPETRAYVALVLERTRQYPPG